MSSGQILMNKVIFFSLQQRRFEQLNSESDKYESDLRKIIQACTEFEPLTSVKPVLYQLS